MLFRSKNESGRLSKEDIEAMVKDAEKFKEEDTKARARVDAKNALENYLYTTKSMVENEETKLSAEIKTQISSLVQEKITWLDANTTASTEEFNDMKNEAEERVRELMSGGDAPPATGAAPSANMHDDGPKIEEVD